MKTSTRITGSICLCLIMIGVFTSTCICTYKYSGNLAAFGGSGFAIVGLFDLIAGIYLFYKKNRTDETKTFGLLIMVVLPVLGAIVALIFNYKLKTEYGKANNDHSRLQSALFNAKKSIKIYADSFFVSNDTFNALNYARGKGIKIELIISIQNKKNRQEFVVMKLQKMLEDKIELHLTEKQIEQSFIIIDDYQVIYCSTNFNFVNIYSHNDLQITSDVNKFTKIGQNDLERTSVISLQKTEINSFKKFKFKLLNIFYPFY